MVNNTNRHRMQSTRFIFRVVTLLSYSGVPCIAAAGNNVEHVGDLLQIMLPVTALLTTYSKQDQVGRVQWFKSSLTSLMMTNVGNNLIKQQSPGGKAKSFGSDHTSAAFNAAAFIHMRYGIKQSLPAYAVASFVGWSRLQSHNHSAQQVIVGALFGIAGSYLQTSNQSQKDSVIVPIMTDDGLGIQYRIYW